MITWQSSLIEMIISGLFGSALGILVRKYLSANLVVVLILSALFAAIFSLVLNPLLFKDGTVDTPSILFSFTLFFVIVSCAKVK